MDRKRVEIEGKLESIDVSVNSNGRRQKINVGYEMCETLLAKNNGGSLTHKVIRNQLGINHLRGYVRILGVWYNHPEGRLYMGFKKYMRSGAKRTRKMIKTLEFKV